MFPNQRFGDVSWHNMHIGLHALNLFYVIALDVNYQRSKLGCRRKKNSTYDTAIHYRKNNTGCALTVE